MFRNSTSTQKQLNQFPLFVISKEVIFHNPFARTF